MANIFKNVIDRSLWVQVQPAPNAHAAGVSICSDARNNITRNPFVYQLASNTILNRFSILNKGWQFVVSPALAGAFGAGSTSVFAPSLGLTGSIGAGCTTTSIVTTTVITSVGANMLANRGASGEYGYRIRIIGKSAGGSGKTEERWITGNTSGTTPTFYLDTALSFTPANGDVYEILGGKVFMLGSGTTAAGSWKSFEVAANTVSGNLSTTGLPGTLGTDATAVALDEQYVPFDRVPGEGFIVGTSTYDSSSTIKSGGLLCLVATATAVGSITGQAAGGDNAMATNRYRNFQIRIVEDTGTPTAVGQRRIIASHTGGAGTTPVYTLGTNWTTQPSATAKFVIEYPNLILLRATATTTVYTYNYSGATINNGTTSINNDAWSTTYFGVGGGNLGGGAILLANFGIEPDSNLVVPNSLVYFFRGGGASTLDVLDIAGGASGTWTNGIVYDGGQLLNTGSCGYEAPATEEGKFSYINFYVNGALNQMFRFDMQNRVFAPAPNSEIIQAGTAVTGNRIAVYTAIDGDEKYSVVLNQVHTTAIHQELIVLV